MFEFIESKNNPRDAANDRSSAAFSRFVPRNVQRDAGRHARRPEDDLTVLELLEDVPGLAFHGKAGEARAAGSDAPRRNGDAKGHRALDEALDVDATTSQLLRQMIVVFGKCVGAAGVVLLDVKVGESEAHVLTSACQTAAALETPSSESFG